MDTDFMKDAAAYHRYAVQQLARHTGSANMAVYETGKRADTTTDEVDNKSADTAGQTTKVLTPQGQTTKVLTT